MDEEAILKLIKAIENGEVSYSNDYGEAFDITIKKGWFSKKTLRVLPSKFSGKVYIPGNSDSPLFYDVRIYDALVAKEKEDKDRKKTEEIEEIKRML